MLITLENYAPISNFISCHYTITHSHACSKNDPVYPRKKVQYCGLIYIFFLYWYLYCSLIPEDPRVLHILTS